MVAPVLPLVEPATDLRRAPAPEQALVCARCGAPITREADRVEKNGAHLHTRINPGGFVYQLGCFAAAPGCRDHGPPTLEHTWFAGHTWRFSDCAACATHLGWRFDGPVGPFWGLIVDRLRTA